MNIKYQNIQRLIATHRLALTCPERSRMERSRRERSLSSPYG